MLSGDRLPLGTRPEPSGLYWPRTKRKEGRDGEHRIHRHPAPRGQPRRDRRLRSSEARGGRTLAGPIGPRRTYVVRDVASRASRPRKPAASRNNRSTRGPNVHPWGDFHQSAPRLDALLILFNEAAVRAAYAVASTPRKVKDAASRLAPLGPDGPPLTAAPLRLGGG